MECPNCSASILDHAKVCPFCQTRLDNTPTRKKNTEVNINNQEKIFNNEKFDISYTISSAEQAQLIRDIVNKASSEKNTLNNSTASRKKKKISNKTRRIIFFTIIAVIFLSLLLRGCIAVINAVRAGKSDTELVYLKNNSLMISDNYNPTLLSNTLIDAEKYVSSQNIVSDNQEDNKDNSTVVSELTSDKVTEIFKENNFVYRTENKRYIYFISDFDVTVNLGKLKCYDAKKRKIIDISENVSDNVMVSKNGEELLFLQNADFSGNSGLLCYKNINKKDVITISEDIDKNMYLFSQNEDKVVFLGNFNHSVEVGDMYEFDIKDKNSEKIKIDSDVCRIFGTDKSGNIFIYAKDYNPARECYDVYKKELDKERVKLTEETKISPIISDTYDEMYMYGGNEGENHNLYLVNVKTGDSKKIASGIFDIVKISEDEASIVYRKIFDNSTSDYYIYTKDNADSFKVANDIRVIPPDNKFSGISQFSVSGDFSTIAYITGFDAEKGKGTLYKAIYNKKNIKEAEKIADEVMFCKCTSDNNRIIYAKNYSVTRDVVDIYSYENSESKLIEDEIVYNLFDVSKNGDNVICIDGFNTVGEYGTLEVINYKGEINKLLDDASAFYILNNNSIVMLKNYNNELQSFDIYMSDKKNNSIKLDDSVTYLVIN